MKTDTTAATPQTQEHHHQHYFVDIEGVEHPWASPTITTEDIVRLGGWDISAGVIEIDRDNNERTLQPGEVIELKPGHGFAKKVKWKRGLTAFEAWLDDELLLIRSRFPDASRDGQWFHIPAYPVRCAGWNRTVTPVAFRAQIGHPTTPPYGIYVPVGMRHGDVPPQNYQEPVQERPPFGGDWGLFSWAPEDGQWRPGATPGSGANLLNFVLGFSARFQQGA